MKKELITHLYSSRILIAIGIASLFALTSCQKFLDKEPLDKLNQATFWKTSSNLQLYTNNMYAWLPGERYFWADGTSDNMLRGAYPKTYDGLDEWMNGETVTPKTAGSGGWTWDGIRTVNLFLDNYAQCEDSPASYAQSLGEAYFFKAYAYHNLVKQFGDVPYYAHTINSNDQEALTKPRDRRALVVDSIMMLLDKSIEQLKNRDEVGCYRLNKETALIYKSRVALFEASWSKYHQGTPSASTVDANAYFQKAIDAYTQFKAGKGIAALYSTGNTTSDYFDLFNKEDYSAVKEVTLSRRYSNNITGAVGSGINWYTTVNYFSHGFTLSMVQSYLDKNGKTIDVTDNTLFPKSGAACLTDFKNTLDPRFAQSVFTPGDPINNINFPGILYTSARDLGLGGYSSAATGYVPKKGNDPTKSALQQAKAGDPTVSAIVFRIPELMLNYVEAYVELHGALPDLSDNIDLIRARVGMPTLTGNLPTVNSTWVNYGYPISDVLAIVRNERRVEFAGEGYRTDDWKRWRAHALFSSAENRPRGFKFSTNDYTAAENKVLLTRLDQKGYYDPEATSLPNGYKWRPLQDYLSPIPLDDIVRSNSKLTQNPGWDTP